MEYQSITLEDFINRRLPKEVALALIPPYKEGKFLRTKEGGLLPLNEFSMLVINLSPGLQRSLFGHTMPKLFDNESIVTLYRAIKKVIKPCGVACVVADKYILS
jgi:hypothetical protein